MNSLDYNKHASTSETTAAIKRKEENHSSRSVQIVRHHTTTPHGCPLSTPFSIFPNPTTIATFSPLFPYRHVDFCLSESFYGRITYILYNGSKQAIHKIKMLPNNPSLKPAHDPDSAPSVPMFLSPCTIVSDAARQMNQSCNFYRHLPTAVGCPALHPKDRHIIYLPPTRWLKKPHSFFSMFFYFSQSIVLIFFIKENINIIKSKYIK